MSETDLSASWKLADFDPGGGEKLGVFSVDYDDKEWVGAQVPGDVHQALVRAGRIEAPFFGENIEACRWVEEREWWYRGRFDYPEEAEPDGRVWLIFEGLDTLCTLYLNEVELGRHEDMFLPVEFDVTERLHQGANTIALRFDPVMPYLEGKAVPGQWTRRAPERASIRKAQYHFGWDWGPRLLTIGPWRGIRIRANRQGRIAGVYFHTHFIDSSRSFAEASVDVTVEGWAGLLEGIQTGEGAAWRSIPGAQVEVKLSRNGQSIQSASELSTSGRLSLALTIPSPELWWTNGLGKPCLYDLEVALRSQDQALDVYHDRVGLRTLTWDQSPDPDEPGTNFFTPVLNGVRIFAKGVDWIPADIFVSQVDGPRHRELLEQAAAAHMNMIRAWGGGVFENDDFYQICDELGILVWQDFMYACAAYPDGDAEFWKYSEREARSAIQRLRNHPCLGIWCGNNEVDWLDDQRVWWQPGRDYPGKRLFHELFPRLVNELAPGETYWPSSPYGGNDHNDAAQGDRHNWQAWHGMVYPRRFGQKPEDNSTAEGVSYHHYAEDFGRFISEFGIQSSPSKETLKRCLPASELYLGSPGMSNRTKDDPKDKGLRYLRPQTGKPADLDQYIDYSMIAQAEGLKFAIEHYRRRMPHCSGTLVWQLNDCWPGISWSLVDYYGFEKAAYFYVKRAYSPIIASFKAVSGGYELWITNDTLKNFEDEITWGLEQFTGDRIVEDKQRICVEANSSQVVAKTSWPRLRRSAENGYLFVHSGRAGFPSNRAFLAEIKDLQREPPQFELVVRSITDQQVEVQLHSERFVYYVKIECPLDRTRYSDNYIDLYPGRAVTISVANLDSRGITPKDLHVTALPG